MSRNRRGGLLDGIGSITDPCNREYREPLSGIGILLVDDHALAAGFELHLAKPVEPTALTLAVAGLAGRMDAPGEVRRKPA